MRKILLPLLTLVFCLTTCVHATDTISLNIPKESAEWLGLSEKASMPPENNMEITENEDGSVTLTMPTADHQKILDDMKTGLVEVLQGMVDDETYSFTDIQANDDFTAFTVYISGTELNLSDSWSSLMFFMYGGMYNMFAGNEVNNIHVDYIDESGNIVESVDSNNWPQSDETALENTEASTQAVTEAPQETSAAESDKTEEANETTGITAEAIETELSEGSTKTIEGVCEFTIESVAVQKDIAPQNPGMFYSHYEADEGRVYVDVCIAYKNLRSTAVSAGEILKGMMTYKGLYEYKGFDTVETENRSDFSFWADGESIKPLLTEYLHYIFEVPEEVMDNTEEVVINMTVDGQAYSIRFTPKS